MYVSIYINIYIYIYIYIYYSNIILHIHSHFVQNTNSLKFRIKLSNYIFGISHNFINYITGYYLYVKNQLLNYIFRNSVHPTYNIVMLLNTR